MFMPLLQVDLMGRQLDYQAMKRVICLGFQIRVQGSSFLKMGKLCFLIELLRKETFLNRSCKVAKAFGGRMRKFRVL